MNEIIERCGVLIEKGNQFISTIKYYEGSPSYYFMDVQVKDIQAWLSSSANIIYLTAKPDSYFYQECQRIVQDENIKNEMPFHVVQKLTGLIESLKDEIESGFFKQLEYIFTASAFDDFLDHAASFHKAGKKTESSVLASTVFEDTIRKIAKKNDVEEAGVNLELIIDDLVKKSIFTPVKSKKMKSHSAVRNKALHAQWDEFDIRDVGELIKGTREAIEVYL